MKRLVALCLLALVAACGESPVLPDPIVGQFGIASGGPDNELEICHLDKVTDPSDLEYDGSPGWELITVKNNKAFEKHIVHGDGVPEGTVPQPNPFNDEGTFDAQCKVITPPPTVPACLQAAIDDFDSRAYGFQWDTDAFGPYTMILNTETSVLARTADFSQGFEVNRWDYIDDTYTCEVTGPLITTGGRSYGGSPPFPYPISQELREYIIALGSGGV